MNEIDCLSDKKIRTGKGSPRNDRWRSALHYALTLAATGAIAAFLFNGFGTAGNRIVVTYVAPTAVPEIDPHTVLGSIATRDELPPIATVAEADPVEVSRSDAR